MTITDEMIYACAAEARTIWLATLPVKGDLPVRQTSLAFSRRMERLLRQQRMTAQEAKRHAWRRVAVAALIAAAALLAAAWTIKTNWAQIVKIVRRVFPEWTEYQYSSGTEAGILPDVAFGSLPDGEIGDEQETLYRPLSGIDDAAIGARHRDGHGGRRRFGVRRARLCRHGDREKRRMPDPLGGRERLVPSLWGRDTG